MGWRLFGFGLLEEKHSPQRPVSYRNETRRSRAAHTLLLDLRRQSDDKLQTLHREQCAGIRSQLSASENGPENEFLRAKPR